MSIETPPDRYPGSVRRRGGTTFGGRCCTAGCGLARCADPRRCRCVASRGAAARRRSADVRRPCLRGRPALARASDARSRSTGFSARSVSTRRSEAGRAACSVRIVAPRARARGRSCAHTSGAVVARSTMASAVIAVDLRGAAVRMLIISSAASATFGKTRQTGCESARTHRRYALLVRKSCHRRRRAWDGPGRASGAVSCARHMSTPVDKSAVARARSAVSARPDDAL